MDSPQNWFEKLAVQDWSKAVFEGAHRFSKVRPDILAALAAENAEVRSAAVATFNEANDAEAHNEVVALLGDPDPHVCEEVIEYIGEFPAKSDVNALLQLLQQRQYLFPASSALQKLYGGSGPLISGEESESEIAAYIEEWEQLAGY
ncbi:MAG: HEAT repeat domain-containing protein [Candidatus Thiodiazotropha taylori]|uniref:HEAT repeat domain-containing protein n=1 Tax=Candidatus Thiodiazotropha taylori TaxID=2792791 RepID=A0A9E4KDA3_9GAMM|nr:HEAT repeat domain-containing protein [Candidatus Thiodiazotropha taylori]MCW4256746.1 HEAT repeat domain-containing protein [Candidatus Thiodiazotropha taylori]